MAGARLVHALRLDEFDQTQLHRFIAVLTLRSSLHYDARSRLQHSAWYGRAIVRENLGHPQLDSKYAVDRHFVRSFLPPSTCKGGFGSSH
jgi:hypothetical protein